MHQVGVGVLGPVFRTYDPSHDRLVAVKVFRLDITPEQAQTLVDALTRLVDVGLSHPAIVAPIAAGVEEDVPYLAQEYVTAESLDVAMRHYAPSTVETALPFIQHLAEAIDAAHELGVVHGGLHLRDIFVTPDQAHATGFGVMKALEAIGLQGPVRRPYTAPELIAGRVWGPEADRFALAAIAYELLTGKRVAGTGELVSERLAAIDGVGDPEGLQAVFATALADVPANRYSSAAGFASGLHDAVGQASGQGAVPVVAGPGGVAPRADGLGTADLLAGLDLHDDSPVREWDEQPIVDAAMESTDDAEDADDGAKDGQHDTLRASPALIEDIAEETDQAVHVDDRELVVDTSEFERPLAPPVEADDGDSLALRDHRVAHDVGEIAEAAEEGEAEDEEEAEKEIDEAEDEEEAEKEIDEAEAEEEVEKEIDEAEAEKEVEKAIDEAEDDEEEAEEEVEKDAEAHDADLRELGEDGEDTDADALPTMGEEFEAPVVVGAAAGDADRGRAWSARAIAPMLAIAAVAAVAAYIVGLQLGAPDEASDRVLETQTVAGSTSRNFSEAAIGDAELAPEPSTVAVPDPPAETELEPDVDPPVSAPPSPPVAVARGVPEPPSPPVAAVVEPEMGFGWLLVRTTLPGATVVVDGVDRGQTPLSLDDLPYGTHRISISRAGYGSETREVSLSRDAGVVSVGLELIEVGSATSAVVGSIRVDSRPDGARVMLDGQLVGTTPVVVPDVASGTHRVRVERDGYQAWVTTVDVPPSDQVRVAASLERVPRR